LSWTLLGLLLQHLVILTKCGTEDDAGDTFKTMDPLLALGALAADVEHVYPMSGKAPVIRIARQKDNVRKAETQESERNNRGGTVKPQKS